MKKSVHVFFGKFASLETACWYTEPQWEDEPADEASDEVYEAWEARNPIWAMSEDLGVYLDSDFVETIDGDLLRYLRTQLANEFDFVTVKSLVPPGSNVMVLIMSEALGGIEARLASTSRLTHCGAYDWHEG